MKNMVKNLTCDFCHQSLPGISTRRMKEEKMHCCDACAIRFIDAGLNTKELRDRGVFYRKALELGWMPVAIRCPACHRFFFPASGQPQKYCREKGCISASRCAGRYHHMKISKHYENDGEPACKTVICNPMNAYRDKLIDAFPVMTKEDFNETRKIVMKAACHDCVAARCIAPAIFYMTLFRLKRKIIAQDTLAKVVGSNAVTLRGYVKRYGYLFGVSIRKEK